MNSGKSTLISVLDDDHQSCSRNRSDCSLRIVVFGEVSRAIKAAAMAAASRRAVYTQQTVYVHKHRHE